MAWLNDAALGVLVFSLAVVVDALFVMWSLSANRGWPFRAAVAAVWIQVCGVMGTLFMVADPWLLALNALGHGLGSYLAVVWALSRKEIGESQ